MLLKLQMLPLSGLKRCPLPLIANGIQVRHKGHILPHKKPRWVGPAKSKMYKNPPQYHAPQAEIEQRNVLHVKYNEHFSALVQYLYEDYLKNSDVGEAAKIEAQKQEEEHQRLVQENDEENQRVMIKKEERLKREMEEKMLQIQQEKLEFEKMKEAKKKELAIKVQQETKALEKQVTAENLEKSILEALANPVDEEYAIDTEGHIYRGRYTRSNLVPESEREKIPVPENKYDLLRHEKARKEDVS